MPTRIEQVVTSLLLSAMLAGLLSSPASARDITQLSGSIELQSRSFWQDPLDQRQKKQYPSIAATAEFYHSWNNQNDALTITPFGRYDAHDDERSHADLREFNWLHVGDGWQMRSGVGKVFWGATESQHLVDIINQTDTLEGVDGEQKLGQPMVNLSLLLDAGEISLFWLPYFRERTFAGINGRPRSELVVDTDNPLYESDKREHHQDWAVRLSYSFDSFDIALSHFSGTSREPLLLPNTPNPLNATALLPFYPLIDQTGLELTSALGDWLWKLEAIHNDGRDTEPYAAAVGGFEYTFVGLLDSDLDLGTLLEYHWDERDIRADSPFQNDIFAGLRLTLNDFQSTELLAGLIYDQDSEARLSFIEASRRLGESFKLTFEARLFDKLPPADPLYSLRRDSHLQLSLGYFF